MKQTSLFGKQKRDAIIETKFYYITNSIEDSKTLLSKQKTLPETSLAISCIDFDTMLSMQIMYT